jgi:hypothetical protein
VSQTPDLSSYYLVHRAIRRSADHLAAALAAFDEPDRKRRRALRWWYDGFAAELHTHHTLEDTIFFPALAEKVPAFAAYEAGLEDDHAHLDEVIASLTAAVHGLTGGAGNAGDHHAVAVRQSAELARFLHQHLGVEDDDVLPLFERHFDADEYAALDGRVIKATPPKHLLFMVPWAVASAEPAEAERLLAEAPLVVRGIWTVTRGRYLRRAALALGEIVPAVAR